MNETTTAFGHLCVWYSARGVQLPSTERKRVFYRKVGEINGTIIEVPVEPVTHIVNDMRMSYHQENSQSYNRKGKVQVKNKLGVIINKVI